MKHTLKLFAMALLMSCSQARVIGDIEEIGRGIPAPIDSVRLYITEEPIRVWRVYDTLRPWSAKGRWWSLQPPSSSLDDYRRSMAICPEWSGCTGLVTGIVKRGEPIIIGTTSAVVCDSVEYGDTSVIQVFIPDTRSLRRIRKSSIEWRE